MAFVSWRFPLDVFTILLSLVNTPYQYYSEQAEKQETHCANYDAVCMPTRKRTRKWKRLLVAKTGPK